MLFENTEVFNFKGALRGMRNPMASWAKSDSIFVAENFSQQQYESVRAVAYQWANTTDSDNTDANFDKRFAEKVNWLTAQGGNYIGPNDFKLMKNLIKGGTEHRKFLRQIMVSVDITAPLYWWKEFDTYKIGTTANSTSTMHKLATTPIKLQCFEIDDFYSVDLEEELLIGANVILGFCESLRQKYLETNDKRYWKELIRWLPESWLQTRTVTMNYENLINIYFQRRNHKLNEWSGLDAPEYPNFCKWVLTLPYMKEIISLISNKN